MTDENNICGEITDKGEICTLPAGWGQGNETDEGPCTHHDDVPNVPQKLQENPEQLIAAVENDLLKGHSVRAACGNNDITEDTHYRWLRLANDLDEDDTSERAELLSEYSERVTRAEQTGDHHIEKHIVDIAIETGDPRTLLKYLQEKRGGAAAHDDPEEDAGWFDDLESAEERVLERHGETEAQ